jgi:hypothetical protein
MIYMIIRGRLLLLFSEAAIGNTPPKASSGEVLALLIGLDQNLYIV